MTPDHKEVEKMAIKFCTRQGWSATCDKPLAAFLAKLLAAQEADFQARLAPWVEAVKKADARLSVSANFIAEDAEAYEPLVGINESRSLLAPILSSPDALRAQAREAEIRAEVWEEAASMVKPAVDMFGEPGRVPGRLLADYMDRAAAERAKAKAADNPKEGA